MRWSGRSLGGRRFEVALEKATIEKLMSPLMLMRQVVPSWRATPPGA